jgi:hypothetical protein
MFSSILKKRINEDKVANIFTNSILKTVEEGFEDVAGLINEAPEFETSPEIAEKDSSKFTLIIIAGNLELLPQFFSTHQEKRLLSLIMDRFSTIFQLGRHDFMAIVADYQKFLSKVNHPSTNVLYGMSKAVFFKYELGQFQAPYFRKLNSPNPLFLKRLDDVMENFIWDWEHLKEKYNLVFK